MTWRGAVAWVRISDKVKTALADESVALTARSESAVFDIWSAAEVMRCPMPAGSQRASI